MKTAIIYSHSATKTVQAAKHIKESYGKPIDDIDVDSLNPNDLKKYDMLILGVPTWFDGELPHYWDELVPAIEDLDLKKQKVAIFGNGDQVGYPENFGDAVGLLAEVFESTGATIVGHTSTQGYTFESSLALRNDKFVGLVLDFENQNKMNKPRIKEWIESID
ncbi:flavodoxin [Bacteroidales bacterium M08MB]|jgi:flavodoxin I|nr:flavodoxin [Perlabentimonas gracilis]NHB69659.1 flavodoxin [Perlabentimonas gracilis]